LLATHCQKYPVTKTSYWYLESKDAPTTQKLPDFKKAEQKVIALGKKIALARKLQSYKCPHGGCPACTPFEQILKGKGKKVGENPVMRRDSYILSSHDHQEDMEEIL
jgi:hypothetical protein